MEVICPYCNNQAELGESKDIYGKDYGKIWICKPCEAWVGTHNNSQRHAPLGRLANSELRYWKQKVHEVFDPMWEYKAKKDKISKSMARTKGYNWLAEQMGIGPSECHIGMFDVALCKQAHSIVCQARREYFTGRPTGTNPRPTGAGYERLKRLRSVHGKGTPNGGGSDNSPAHFGSRFRKKK